MSVERLSDTIFDPTNKNLFTALEELINKSSSLASYIGPGPALFQFDQFAEALRDAGLSVDGKKCIEIGCGFARPYGLATLLSLCGAKSIIGIDDAKSSDPGAVANTILLTVLISMLQPEKAGFDKLSVGSATILENAKRFNLQQLFKLKLDGSVPESIRIRHCRFEGLTDEEKEFDVAVSQSVFEHVDDMPGLMANLRQNISDDGFIFAGLDYRDHRIYSNEERRLGNIWLMTAASASSIKFAIRK